MPETTPTSSSAPEGFRRVRNLGILLVAGGLVGALGLGLLYRAGVTPEMAFALLERILQYLQDRPLLLFLGTALLPGLGMPSSPFIILSGVVYSERFGLVGAVALTQLAISICMTWTYFAVAYPLRSLMERILKYVKIPIPDLSRKGYREIIFIVRATPGLPFVFQNTLLGLLKVPLVPYLLISFAVSVLYVAGFVVFGKALIEGSFTLVMAAVVILVVAGLGIRTLLRRRQKSKGDPSP